MQQQGTCPLPQPQKLLPLKLPLTAIPHGLASSITTKPCRCPLLQFENEYIKFGNLMLLCITSKCCERSIYCWSNNLNSCPAVIISSVVCKCYNDRISQRLSHISLCSLSLVVHCSKNIPRSWAGVPFSLG